MKNIVSYLKWRGDLPLCIDSFNEIDNLVLAYLSYFDFKNIVPDVNENRSISIKEAVELYFQSTEQQELFKDSSFLKVLAGTNRFGNALLWNYEDIYDNDREKIQFAAMHIILEDGTSYVSFRGTDDKIVGWREDFSMSFEIVPAQKRAVEYLAKTIKQEGATCYRIGGHSKGGNLAAYGAMMCSRAIQERIIRIYMNDSPGFCPAILDKDRYSKIEPKIIRIVPEFSIIGMLFGKEVPERIVKSNADGLLQHDAITWQIEGNHFVEAPGLTPKSKIYNEIFDRWIESADMEQRKTFTTDFFDALEAGGAKTMMEVVKGGVNNFESILYAMVGSKKDSKVVVGKLIGSFWEEIKKIEFKELFHRKMLHQGIAAFLIGALFIIVPNIGLSLIGTAFFLWLMFFSVNRIRELLKKKDCWTTEDKVKILFYSIVAILEMLCILFNNIVVISTNFILGFFFAWRAYYQIKNAAILRKKENKFWILPVLEAVIACILALVVLAKSGQGMENYILVAGTYLTIGGMVTIGKAIFEATKIDN